MSTKGPGRPRQTTHDDIRAIALALFAEQGYAATSLAQIAAAAGISRTTLFSYFPAKRDLMWDEFDAGVERMRASLASSTVLPLVDALVDAMLATARYDASEHDAFARRWQIVHADDELRAATTLRTAEFSRALIDEVRARAPGADAALVDHVAHALMAVSDRCTEEWATAPSPPQSLDAYTAERLRPFADALRPLLEQR